MNSANIAITGKPDTIIPLNDKERLAALFRYELLDTPPEAFFDRITRLASRLLKAPSAFVSLVDKDRVWYKSNYSTLEVSCVDREDSLCSLTIINGVDVTVFEDTHLVPGLLTSPYVSAPGGIRFYAGAPLITRDNYNIGTVCVIDSEPRSVQEEEKEILKDLANLVVEQIELRSLARKATRKHDELYTNLAHNIAEPLKEQQVLLGEALKSPERTNVIRKAHATVNVLQENLQTMLQESLQEEELVMHPQQIAISEIARSVAVEFEPLANAKQQELFFTVASRRELFVDPDLIREALRNLVSTSIKFTPKGSSIGLDIYESDGIYKVEVSSDASVLTKQDLRKVFFKYAILTGKTTGNEDASGMELPRAKSIIELHQGRIWAEPTGKESGKKFVVAFNVE
ncbi:GAF domain-containing protein [Pontibacter diazotrophicus]|uniref:GAF domain-containing protein n=1 Tax=Pontibacter diazotrophicus TaxID=1400979 RepID=A0A3D8L992_9BACT|nr:GAF domain-containing sensor histidine kinase [Pontibacter diazotrophicus]RDV13989.1 GAF domain-containing protein [Pontibacter diazotrophicus]